MPPHQQPAGVERPARATFLSPSGRLALKDLHQLIAIAAEVHGPFRTDGCLLGRSGEGDDRRLDRAAVGE
jgi:hypothetical protein